MSKTIFITKMEKRNVTKQFPTMQLDARLVGRAAEGLS